MRKVTLGGDRLGSGKKQKVELHGYERSTHDLGYLWRSTMSAGTLVPFLHEIGLPGDTFDINLGADIKTHPTVGPLFGSYKVQLDIFTADVRLYQGQLHNNKLKVGLNMASVKLPQMTLATTMDLAAAAALLLAGGDIDNAQINPSCIHAYLGIRGIGILTPTETEVTRDFQAIYLLAYWDTYKNYYANKQEEIGAVIHTPNIGLVETIDDIDIRQGGADIPLPQAPTIGSIQTQSDTQLDVNYTGADPIPSQIIFRTSTGFKSIEELFTNIVVGGGIISGDFNWTQHGEIFLINWDYATVDQLPVITPTVATFPLENLDNMREQILEWTTQATPFSVNTFNDPPYEWVVGESVAGTNKLLATQEGLAIKTYQSDLFNNWLRTEYIDGPGGINEITAIDTSGGSFTIDTLNLSKKVYNMLNRIAVSGGTYIDWIIATYDHEPYAIAETPIYHGGLSKELIFQEVVSTALSNGTGEPTQPLGTLAGKGQMAQKHKGGQISIKVAQHCVVIGLISLTPRIDYSQGNKWDTHLLTMDDFHKPPLDEIGFQELITEQMAWWSTRKNLGGLWIQKSAGKQPAWINYMTNVNEVRGNFAIQDNEMFMTLNRRYEPDITVGEIEIKDLTTYIDPVKFNYIFAETALDAQNFWAQVAIDMTVRRKMSAKVMPNL